MTKIRIGISFCDRIFFFSFCRLYALQHSYMCVIVDCGLTHHKIAIHNVIYKLKIALQMINLFVLIMLVATFISLSACLTQTNKVNVQIWLFYQRKTFFFFFFFKNCMDTGVPLKPKPVFFEFFMDFFLDQLKISNNRSTFIHSILHAICTSHQLNTRAKTKTVPLPFAGMKIQWYMCANRSLSYFLGMFYHLAP